MIEVHPWHFDGRNATRWKPVLKGDIGGFRLIGEGWESGPWHWSDLVAMDAPEGQRLYGHRHEHGWRLGFAEDIPAELDSLLPRRPRYGGIIDRIGLLRASVLLASGAALLIFVGVKAPGWLAPYIPQSWEDNMGDAMVGNFGGRYCHTQAGDLAVKALVQKVDPERRARSIEVANVDMVNAVALPGRRIILFRGLVEKANSPDEVAGILGHELGHVRHRDTLTAMMRQMGLSVILGGLSGDMANQLNGVMAMSYSREAEHEADLAALDTMKVANISPAATADFFRRMDVKDAKRNSGKDVHSAAEISDIAEWMSSHPSSESRYSLFTKSVRRGHSYSPSIGEADWRALQNMCAQDRKAASGWNSALAK